MVHLPDMNVQLLGALGHEVAGGADMSVRIIPNTLQVLVQGVVHVSHCGIKLRMRPFTVGFQVCQVVGVKHKTDCALKFSLPYFRHLLSIAFSVVNFHLFSISW